MIRVSVTTGRRQVNCQLLRWSMKPYRQGYGRIVENDNNLSGGILEKHDDERNEKDSNQ
jgi:bifunctional N-acetylglucosamine-1-phosphate-uridyltransferase/glucosamine-1-phosphate-acetyltransferase GlmU-like protein